MSDIQRCEYCIDCDMLDYCDKNAEQCPIAKQNRHKAELTKAIAEFKKPIEDAIEKMLCKIDCVIENIARKCINEYIKYSDSVKYNPTEKMDIINKGEQQKMKIMLDEGAKMPTRAHETDAGLDIYARETQIVPARESAKFDTGVHIEIPEGYVGFLKSKSGLNVKHGITSEGVIDCGYTGSIVVKLYNNSGYDYTVNAGDKISQLVILPIITPELELVSSLEDTERGNNGFGSSGY